MICYRDMTFCPFHEECGIGDACMRALTDEVIADAQKWWSWFNGSQTDGVPICQYAEKPNCFTKEEVLS